MMERLLALALAAMTTACSFAMTERLPGNYTPDQTPRCSANAMTQVGDVIGSIYATGGIVVHSVTIANEERDTPIPQRRAHRINLAFNVGALLAYVAAGFYGHHQRRRCRAARAAHEVWIQQHPTGAAR